MKKLILILGLLFINNLYAGQSMRHCMLLPIADNVQGALGFKVYEEIEHYLREGTWCYYRTNSEILNILSNYKTNLSEHLKNKDVLQVVADKTKTGSLIRISLAGVAQGMKVSMEIISDLGDELYFKQEADLPTVDLIVISQTIKNWLSIYEKTIPYDGRVIGVLGTQFTVDIGKDYSGINSAEVMIMRPSEKKHHPLLKEVVEWEKEKIGEGKIFHVSENQSQGNVLRYEGAKKIQRNDWVLINRKAQNPDEVVNVFQKPDDELSFGKMGQLKIGLILDDATIKNVSPDGSQKQMGGWIAGGEFGFEVWATRNYWGEIELEKKFGSLKKQQGELAFNSNSTSNSAFKAKVGYKYLPIGFFYGPQVDGYVGYAKYDFDVDHQGSDGFVQTSFSGLMLGVRGDVPIYTQTRVFIAIDFTVDTEFEENQFTYGEEDSASSFNLELGANYNYSPVMTIYTSYDLKSCKATFLNKSEYSFKDSAVNFGAKFTF
jgi:hypothetical protein